MASRVLAHGDEGAVHVDPGACAEHTFRLLDGDSTAECVLELFGDQPTLAGSSVLQNPDGRDVGEGLGDLELVGLEDARLGAEQVERADDLIAEGASGGRTRS